jgi:hypothetical protein
MKLGAEDKKKVYALAALGVVAAIAFYTQVLSDGGSPSPAPAPAPKTTLLPDPTAAVRPTAPAANESAARPTKRLTQARGDDFRPTLHSKRPEDRIDPLTVDPTLRNDLLAKVQAIQPEGGSRNLFQFGAAQPKELPKTPEPKIQVVAKMFDYPRPLPPPPPKPADPPPPPEPPINMKYYGVATKQIDGKRTAFFLDGDEIVLAPEGSVVKKKYRVVRVGATSVVMENTENRKQQTLPLAEDAGANLSN